MEPSNIKQHFQGRHCRAVQTHQDWISFYSAWFSFKFHTRNKVFLPSEETNKAVFVL